MAKEYNPEDAVIFVNIADRDFVCRYDGRKYLVPAGAEMPFRLPVAQHFAKHLADQLLQEEYDKHSIKVQDRAKTNRARLWIDPKRPKLYALMIPELADDLEAMILGAEALASSLDERDGLQTPTALKKPTLAPKTTAPAMGQAGDEPSASLQPSKAK